MKKLVAVAGMLSALIVWSQGEAVAQTSNANRSPGTWITDATGIYIAWQAPANAIYRVCVDGRIKKNGPHVVEVNSAGADNGYLWAGTCMDVQTTADGYISIVTAAGANGKVITGTYEWIGSGG